MYLIGMAVVSLILSLVLFGISIYYERKGYTIRAMKYTELAMYLSTYSILSALFAVMTQ